MPPVISLAACYTDAAASQDGVSFAARLCARGAAAVIATETSITDTYATRLLARLYGTLARSHDPDVVAALAEARREVQAELETSPDKRDNELAGLGEWAAVTVLAASGSVPVLDAARTAPAVAQPSRPRIAGLAGAGGLVLRRAAARTAPLAGRPDRAQSGGHRGARDRRDRQNHPGRRDHHPPPGPRPRPGPGQPDRAADPGKPARRGDLRDPPGAAGPRRPGQRGDPGPGCRRPGRCGLAGPPGDPARARPGSCAGAGAAGQLRRQPRTPRHPGMRSAIRCWPGCWPPGSPTRGGPGCWSPPGIRSPCPMGQNRRCRSGSWGRCHGRRR